MPKYHLTITHKNNPGVPERVIDLFVETKTEARHWRKKVKKEYKNKSWYKVRGNY